MQYEVLPIQSGTPEAVADSIATAYEKAANHGGKVVAGHTLTCDQLEEKTELTVLDVARPQYLFLVVELPNGGSSPQAGRVIASKGGGPTAG